MHITFRHATPTDLETMLAWRGHSAAARVAITAEFNRLSSGENRIFLAFDELELVGTVQLVRQHPDPDLTRAGV